MSLEYEAYQPMAKKQLELLADDIREKWPGVEHVVLQVRCRLLCRIGQRVKEIRL